MEQTLPKDQFLTFHFHLRNLHSGYFYEYEYYIPCLPWNIHIPKACFSVFKFAVIPSLICLHISLLKEFCNDQNFGTQILKYFRADGACRQVAAALFEIKDFEKTSSTDGPNLWIRRSGGVCGPAPVAQLRLSPVK